MNPVTNPLALLAIALAVSPAWAVNKCTGPDGAVVFQDAPCGVSTMKAETVRSSPAVTGISQGSWSFEKGVDSMTGRVSCMALSPIQYVRDQGSRDLRPVRIAVSALDTGRFLAAVRIETTGVGIFHNDLVGMGAKADPGRFYAITLKGGQKVVGFADGSAALDGILLAKSVRLRLRFWPYETLIDSNPITTSGMPQAIRLAAECAKVM